MNKKLLKYLIYIAGIIGLYAFFAVRILPMFNLVLIEDRHPDYFEFTKYGELYYFSQIKHFREELPFPKGKYRLSEKQSSAQDADIIAFGDSFFDFNRQKTVAERLHDTLDVAVHAVNAWFPYSYFYHIGYEKADPIVIIFEVVERNIPFRFKQPHTRTLTLNPPEPHVGFRGMGNKVKKFIFPENDEELYSVMLKGSYLTEWLYTNIATFKFDALGYISSRTPVYDLDQFGYPVLFYDLTVNDSYTSFYYEHTDEMIDTYCDNITDLANKLKKDFNLDMLFLPIPNKYTLYYDKIDPDAYYDNFLPRLYNEMEKRNIKYVNVYDDFARSDRQLFYGTDTHWNKNGVDIAVERLLEHLSENPSLSGKVRLSLLLNN